MKKKLEEEANESNHVRYRNRHKQSQAKALVLSVACVAGAREKMDPGDAVGYSQYMATSL